MLPLERKVSRAGLAALDVATALALLATWLAPGVFGVHGLRDMVLLSFFAALDVLFLSTLGRREASRSEIAASLLVLLVFGIALAATYESWMPLLAVARGIAVAVLVQPRDEADAARGNLRAKLTLLLLLGSATVTFLPVPPRGITPEDVDAIGPRLGDVFFDVPQVALSLGVLFFLGSAAVEWWVGGLSDGEVRRRASRIWLLR